MEVVLYGITNCDQVRKARTWLTAAGVTYRFHDFRSAGLDPDRLAQWLRRMPWDSLLNRKGTTWRKLDERNRQAVTDQLSAQSAMLADLRIIKRPVLEHGERLLVGFSEPLYRSFFGQSESQVPHDP
jgi:arsenate reductase